MTKPMLKEDTESASVIPLREGIGSAFKTLRQSKRITLSEASGRIKFSTRQIQALENEEWSMLPTGVPLRGLVKNYARFLEADVDAMMVMLESQVSSAAPPRSAIEPVKGGAAFTPTDLPSQGEESGFPWGWLLIIVALLVVAGFYAVDQGWIPESWLAFEWFKSL
jgi:cytoskeletal protein RodZ